MSTNTPLNISMVLLSGAVIAMIALSSPALARGGGHHQGECGEHRSAGACGYVEHEAHPRGDHGHLFEDHHRLGYPGSIVYPGDRKGVDDSGPSTTGGLGGSGNP